MVSNRRHSNPSHIARTVDANRVVPFCFASMRALTPARTDAESFLRHNVPRCFPARKISISCTRATQRGSVPLVNWIEKTDSRAISIPYLAQPCPSIKIRNFSRLLEP
jgi:hypothetical protein